MKNESLDFNEERIAIERERLNEEIENLYRYVDIQELVSLFGKGNSFEERIKTGINNPNLWCFMNIRGAINEQEVKLLVKTIGSDNSEIDLIKNLGNIDTDPLWYDENFNLSDIGQTIRGFSVNHPASNYRTPYLLKIYLGNKIKIKVGDLKGDKKIVLFEPTYVSTPRIKVNGQRRDLLRDGVLEVSIWGSFKDDK